MEEKVYKTICGEIHYWINMEHGLENPTLIFLPGLTADHRLFDKQIADFEEKYNVFVWDAPGHAKSWPFAFTFSLMDKAKWLDEILCSENIQCPIIIGQSMGGYVGQAYSELYPDKLKGFVSIDSAPLQRSYVTGIELWLLKRMVMHEIMMTYDGDQKRYAKISGHGFKILAEAMEANLPYKIKCPAQLICGEKDHAGSCIRYNKAWHKKSGIPIAWIKNAGHNSNTDAPEEVNSLIEKLVNKL